MDVKIREITPDEVLETAVIYVACLHHDYAFMPPDFRVRLDAQAEAEECEAWLVSDPVNAILAAFSDGRMLGYVAVGRNTVEPVEYEGEVTGLFVHPDWRSQGLGMALLRRAASYFLGLGHRGVVIYNFAASTSNGYYRSLGGRVVKCEVQTVAGEPFDVDVFGWELTDLADVLNRRLSALRNLRDG